MRWSCTLGDGGRLWLSGRACGACALVGDALSHDVAAHRCMLVKPQSILIRRFPLFTCHAHPFALNLGIHLTVASALIHRGQQPAVFSLPALGWVFLCQTKPVSLPFRFAPSAHAHLLTSLPLPSSRWTAPRSCSLVLF